MLTPEERRMAEDAAQRRQQRLREVREQEKKIAAATRSSFRETSARYEGVLLSQEARAWEERHEDEVNLGRTKVQQLLRGIGEAHGAAAGVVATQAADAAANLELWKRELEHEAAREARAALAVATRAAEEDWARQATATRRAYVAETEASRAKQVATSQQSAAAASVEAARQAAAQAAAEAAMVPLTVQRSRVRVDYASSHLHDAGGTSRPYAFAAVRRHAALGPATGSSTGSSTGGGANGGAGGGGANGGPCGAVPGGVARFEAAASRGAVPGTRVRRQIDWGATEKHGFVNGFVNGPSARERAEEVAGATERRLAAAAADAAAARQAAAARGSQAHVRAL
jgi:hypothetical protein